MIYYNLNNINDWNFGEDNIIKVYRNNAVCYYKVTSGDTPTPVQEPCFAVVDNISQYSDTEFEDVFNLADNKWYKLNNLNQYEEYGIYGSGRTITTYDGKLTVDDGYEYMYSGGSWVNVGEISGGTIQTVWFDPPSSGDNARFDIGHYWGENYKMIWTMYIQGSYSNDTSSFWRNENKSPIEFSLYSNGYYYDMHNPTSTSSPSVYTGDYSYRIIRNNVFRNYENSQVMNITLTYGSFKAELVDSGTVIENTGSTRTGFSWYNGLYEPSIFLQSAQKCHLSRIQVYNASNVLVNDITFVKNNGVTGSQEISMYDSVLNVTYNNTNSNTPTYHIVEEGGGGYEYPLEYVVREDPPDNLVFSSMTEAEAYECPWVGMKAKIDGDNYVFSGDSQSGYEWVYQPILFYTLQELIDIYPTSGGSYEYRFTNYSDVSGITYFRFYPSKGTSQSSYVFADHNADNATSTTKFAIKANSVGDLYSSVGGYSTLKAAADSSSCSWAYWIDADTIEIDVVAAVGTTIFIKQWQSNFVTDIIAYKFG